jgi:hypothetical protein
MEVVSSGGCSFSEGERDIDELCSAVILCGTVKWVFSSCFIFFAASISRNAALMSVGVRVI